MSKITFLPENYEAPKASGNYMKIADGENKIRILTQPILGWLDWVNNKPVRYRYDAKPVKSADPVKPIKHFWAFVVWNYNESRIQIMEITQSTIRSALQALCDDTDWGAPFSYDVKITKKGQAVDTEYAVTPVPSKPLDGQVKLAFDNNRCNLDALFDGVDPFAVGQNRYTTGMFGEATANAPELTTTATLSSDQVQTLLDIWHDCDEAYVKSVKTWMKTIKASEYKDIPADNFARLKAAATKRVGELRASAAA